MPYRLLLLWLLTAVGCSKTGGPEEGLPTEPNTLILLAGTQAWTIPITQHEFNGGSGAMSLTAKNAEVEILLNAVSQINQSGAGIYNLTCCNKIEEKSLGGHVYEGIDIGSINGVVLQKGRLEITNVNLEEYSGTFSFTGKNSTAEEKTFTGRFKAVY